MSPSSARRPTPPSPTSCRASTSASTTPSSAWGRWPWRPRRSGSAPRSASSSSATRSSPPGGRSIDRLSGGRFIFGVGAGWPGGDGTLGTDPSRRFGIMRERVEAMKAMWTEDELDYHGEYVDFDPIWLYPKPVQRPTPGPDRRQRRQGARSRPRLRRRLVPEPDRRREHNIPRIEELQRRAAEAGRDLVPSRSRSAQGPRLPAPLRAGGRHAACSCCAPPTPPRDTTERKLDEWAGRIAAYEAG